MTTLQRSVEGIVSISLNAEGQSKKWSFCVMSEKTSVQPESFLGCSSLGVLPKLQIQLTNSSSGQLKAAFVCAIPLRSILAQTPTTFAGP